MTSNLAASVRARLTNQAKAKKRMDELAEKAGIIILASHQPDLLKKTCNKVLELEHGRVKRFGEMERDAEPALEVESKPARSGTR